MNLENRNMKKTMHLIGVIMLIPVIAFSQAPENWFNLAFDTDSVYGAETNKAYDLLKGKEAKPVVVAVIDSGVDEDHEDLVNVMWVNPGETINSGRDDDNNKYVDDINGWNFIGGADGNVDKDNLEVTRLYRMYEEKFKDVKNPTTLGSKEKMEYARYLKVKKDTKNGRENALKNLDRYQQQKENIMNGLKDLEKMVGSEPLNLQKLEAIETEGNSSLALVINIAKNGIESEEEEEVTVDYIRDAVTEGLGGALDYFDTQANYHYNKDFNPRPIVGDDYSDPYQRDYGNNEYEGPDAFHGTHVAGIIAAERGNDLGIDGVANHAKIMTVRAVPDGDERDKDVAAAIIYAVDNGASIINMSFGKGYSWNKDIVDEAVKYAAKNDVLLVHAAGNSAQNNDDTDNFPNDTYDKSCWLFCKKNANDNWIEVGALSYVYNENLPASFSNYGKNEVDLFAPGVAIYSTTPDNEYQNAQGTSMASPVVAGVSALLRSYFPELTAKQVKEILMESSTKIDMEVKKPGTQDLVPFSSLSVSGGTVNAYEAVKLAMETKGKKKTKKGA
jgi:subtilisin family serine protease